MLMDDDDTQQFCCSINEIDIWLVLGCGSIL